MSIYNSTISGFISNNAVIPDTTDADSTLIIMIAFLVMMFSMVIMITGATIVRYKKYKHHISRKEKKQKEVAGRRRIRLSDKYEVLERDNYTCQICGISRDYLNSLSNGLGDYLLLEVDHIQSVSRGGRGDDIDNLQCLCWRCNRKKGGRLTNEEVKDRIDYGMNFLDIGF